MRHLCGNFDGKSRLSQSYSLFSVHLTKVLRARPPILHFTARSIAQRLSLPALSLKKLALSYIVGYQNFEVNEDAGIAKVGAAFAPINAEGKWTCTTQIFGNDIAAGDVLYVFNADVWDLDYFQKVSSGWAYFTSDPETGDPIDSVVASFELQQGDQTYFQPNDGVSGLTVAGQVTDMTKPAAWTMEAGVDIADIMNPYPVATTLKDLESFAKPGDVIYVFNENVWDLDYYQFVSVGRWAYFTSDPETGDPIDSVVTDTNTVVLPAGVGGVFQPTDTDGRTWTVTL